MAYLHEINEYERVSRTQKYFFCHAGMCVNMTQNPIAEGWRCDYSEPNSWWYCPDCIERMSEIMGKVKVEMALATNRLNYYFLSDGKPLHMLDHRFCNIPMRIKQYE